MATYKEIHGVKVQYRDSDATAIEGDVWYNSSTGKLKMYAALGAWTSGGDVNTGRLTFASANRAPSTTTLIVAGMTTGNDNRGLAEVYDGSSWTEVADLVTEDRKEAGGAGTSTAALFIGGSEPGGPKKYTEAFDGSSWSEVADLNVGGEKHDNATAGTQTAALFIGGSREVSPGNSATVESYNGTSWTEIADLNAGCYSFATGFGISTAALLCGGGRGEPASLSALVEEWNGTSWTEVGDINDARNGMGGAGTTTHGLLWAGFSPAVMASTEEWDGSTWTETTNLSTASCYGGGGGTASSATAVAGSSVNDSGNALATTEEWEIAASVETVAFD